MGQTGGSYFVQSVLPIITSVFMGVLSLVMAWWIAQSNRHHTDNTNAAAEFKLSIEQKIGEVKKAATDGHSRLEDQIKSARDTTDRWIASLESEFRRDAKRRDDELRIMTDGITALKTELVGINGTNGVKGEVFKLRDRVHGMGGEIAALDKITSVLENQIKRG